MENVRPLLLLLGASQTVYLGVVLTLGVRLLLLARRTRQLPEAMLATHFLLCGGLGYLLSVTALAAARHPGLLPPGLVSTSVAAGHLSSCTGVFGAMAFTYLVFRRGSAWGRALLALGATTMAVGYVGYGSTGGFTHGSFQGLWFWLFYGTFIAAAVWVMAEPLLYRRRLRRRLRLGLADPVVVDRFRLWGIGSGFRLLMLLGGWAAGDVDFAQSTALLPPQTIALLVLVACVGLGLACCYWLAFFPPAGYLRWVQRATRPSPA
jgi:hypothetical protein